MDDPRTVTDYTDRPPREGEPPFTHIVRELEWLQVPGYIEITERYTKIICVRLTALGRAAIEQKDEEKQPPGQDHRPGIGFSIDDD